jgi:hypothetical protein
MNQVKKFVFSFLAVSLVACASMTRSTSTIGLHDVEKVKMGVSSDQDLVRVFGHPGRILPDTAASQELWVYFDDSEGSRSQRASFVLDSRKRTVISAAWIPRSSDSMHRQDQILRHFGKSSALEEARGELIAQHEFPSEKIFRDPQKGLVIWVNSATQEVQMVGFKTPGADRVISHN